MPAISVILPARNAADTIARAVRSILDQSLSDLELIVVDDGSSDETAAIVSAIDDPRLKLVAERRAGVASAFQAGYRLARSELVARMDADDVAHRERLACQREMMQRQRLDAVGCRVRILDSDGSESVRMRRYERWINKETLSHEEIMALRFVELPLVNPSILARREYFDLQYREGDFPEDYDLFLRAAARGLRFGKAPRVLLDWTDRDARLSRTDPRYSLDAFTRCRRGHLLSGPLRDQRVVDLWGVGQAGKPWLRWLLDQGVEVGRVYDIDRRKIGQKMHGIVVLHPQELTRVDGAPLLIAVGAEDAREAIRPQLEAGGYQPGRDAWFVA